MLKPLLARLRRSAVRWSRRGEFERDILPRLPEGLRDAARFVFDEQFTAEESRIAANIESFRGRIKEVAGKELLTSHPSPKPATFHTDDHGHAVAAPLTASPVEEHMKTGATPVSGILLRRIAVGTRAGRILELGTNTGLSGCYFLSSPHCQELVTIEGSAELCEVARSNLARISDNGTVMNMYFDDAIDRLSTEGAKFDCAYIDGQHEREATLHYADRVRRLLREGGCLIFDDIRWSKDMYDAWLAAREDRSYSMSIDLGQKGVCVVGDGTSAKPVSVDMSGVLGKSNPTK